MSVQPPPVDAAEGAAGSDLPGSSFRPYVPDQAEMPEMTVSAVLLGAVLGIGRFGHRALRHPSACVQRARLRSAPGSSRKSYVRYMFSYLLSYKAPAR